MEDAKESLQHCYYSLFLPEQRELGKEETGEKNQDSSRSSSLSYGFRLGGLVHPHAQLDSISAKYIDLKVNPLNS